MRLALITFVIGFALGHYWKIVVNFILDKLKKK